MSNKIKQKMENKSEPRASLKMSSANIFLLTKFWKEMVDVIDDLNRSEDWLSCPNTVMKLNHAFPVVH